MPSRKDMVEWLREAGRIDVALARMNGAGEEGSKDFALPWERRAEQVASMRCETCAKEYYQISTSSDPSLCPWRGCGGCFAHKPKEKPAC